MNLVTFFTLISVVHVSLSVGEFELTFVTFVHRHGDRSPVTSYPTDPFRNESLWNNGWGQLTTAGKQRAYNLGKWFRERYADFLPRVYNEEDYEAQSTDVSRTLMSAYLLLAGLYEPTGSDVWDSEIKWQPIPVHTTPLELDNVLAASKPCPRHEQLFAQLIRSDEMSGILSSVAPTLSEIVRHAGYVSTDPLSDFFSVVTIADSLLVQSLNGFQLPEWSRPYFPQPMQDMSSLFLRTRTYNKPLQRLSCGLLVKDILLHFKLKSKGVLTKKIWQYSAHDITITGLMQCLNLNERDAPPFSSALILELLSKNGQFYVRILYKTGETLRTLVVPGCEDYCPLEVFEELMTPIIPTDWEAECNL